MRALRTELGTTQGTVTRVADQLGYGRETVRKWVRDDEITNGATPTVAEQSTAEQRRIAQLEQENRERKRANAILKSASLNSRVSATVARVAEGVANSRRLRGRRFNLAAIASKSAWVRPAIDSPFGRYWRSRPFVFSFVPRCQGGRESQKKTGTLVSSVSRW